MSGFKKIFFRAKKKAQKKKKKAAFKYFSDGKLRTNMTQIVRANLI